MRRVAHCAAVLLAAAFGWLLTAELPCAAMEWEKTETSLALRDGQRVVWRFSAGPEAGKPYFHPLTLPDGTVATDHRPADHKWHLGVWFTFNKLNGVNFWGEDENGRIWGPGRIKVEEIVFETRGVAILDHPKNPRYPTCWGGLAYNANVWLADEMRLAKGEQFELRYRMVFFARQVPSSFLEEQHTLFSQQP